MNELFDAVEIEVNSDCNRSCSYCPNSLEPRLERGEIESTLYLRIIEQLASIHFKGRISFHFYNEPLLCSELASYVRYARQKLPSAKIVLYTNGTLLSKTKFDKLIAAGVTRFIVTKHEGVAKLELEDFIKELPEHLKELIFLRDYKNMPLTNRGGILPHLGFKKLPHLLPCYIPSHVVSITLKGNILPCFEDVMQKEVMGNVAEESLMSIWHSSRYQEFRQKLRHGLRHKFDLCHKCNRVNARPINQDPL